MYFRYWGRFSTYLWWRSENRLFPLATMFQYFFNCGIIFNKGDDFHCPAAFRTLQGICLINSLYQRSPLQAAFFNVRRFRFEFLPVSISNFRSWCYGSHSVFTQTPVFIGILAVISCLMFTFIRNVLRNCSQEIQWLIYLKIAGITSNQIIVTSFWERDAVGGRCPI